VSREIRIPFDLAIEEKRLLRPRFEELSLPQQVVLKATYGLPLSADKQDERGWSEVDHYWALRGYGEWDPLGYLVKVTPPVRAVYTPQEFPESWLVCGVRAGKSEIAAFISTYEATCGGHEAWTRKGKQVVWFQIAQDLALAQYSLHGIKANLESMAFMAGRVKAVTARRIDLWNGVTIATNPPTVKSVRGYDSPGAVMDEVGVWWQETESANPDFEIYNQLVSRQAQFSHPKIVGLSSPWNKAGLLYQRFEAGTEGEKLFCEVCRGDAGRRATGTCGACAVLRLPHAKRLVLHATTASLGNPLIKAQWLEDYQKKDPRAFERECLAKFQDSLSGFLDSTLLRKAVSPGCTARPPQATNFYVAAIDPAFRGDAFGFCIAHADPDKGVVIDYLLRELPSPGEKVDPEKMLAAIAAVCRRYHIIEVLTDQFSIEALKQMASHEGLSLRDITFSGKSKAAIYANLQQLLNTGRLHLLDHPETLRELMALERQNLQGGATKIAGPRGEHDDMATVVALACHAAVWMLPDQVVPDTPPPGAHELCFQQVERRRQTISGEDGWD
jgi:hypothetical protein